MRALRETKTHILFLLLSCSILLIRVCQGFSLPARITGARPKGATRLDTGISKHALLPRAGSSTGQETVVTEAVNGSHNKPQHAPSPQKDSEEGGDGLDEIDDHERELLYGETLLNGEKSFLQEIFEKLRKVNIRKKDLMPDAPPLTFNKFLTMQQKRVVVTFRYTDLPYLRPYYLTFASKLKRKHSDLFIEKRVLPVVDGSSTPIFEVLVDGKIVIGGGQSRERHVLGGRVDVERTQSVYVSMEQLGHAISKARKKRRPSTLYGGHNGEDNPEMKKNRRTFVH